MQRAVLACRLAVLIIAVGLFAGRAAHAAPAEPVRIEVWCVGDDGLTLRLKDDLLSALRSSPDFVLSNGKKTGSLMATIPTNLEWKRDGKRIRVLYTIEFTSTEDRRVGSSRGSCWEDSLTVCTASIVRDAKKAARAIH